MSKATIIKNNKVVATADSVKEAQAYAKKVGGKVLVAAAGKAAKAKPRKNGAESVAAVIKAAGASIKKRPLPADLCRKLLKADGYRSIPSDLAKLRMEAYHVIANHVR